MKKVFLIPREGVKVREESGLGHFPQQGDTRMLTTYLNRRIKDGDLLVRDDAPAAGPKPEVEKNTETGKKPKKNQGEE